MVSDKSFYILRNGAHGCRETFIQKSTHICPCGEIGIRRRFKIFRLHRLVGSSPTRGI